MGRRNEETKNAPTLRTERLRKSGRDLDHAIIPAVDGDLGTGGGVEDGAGDLADHGGDAGGGDFGAEEVFGFVFLDAHAVALGGFFEGFVGPDFGVEDGIGMQHVHADAEFGEFEGGDASELGDAGFGDGVGGGAGSGSGEVAGADDDDARLLVAFLEGGNGELEEALGRGEVDLEMQVPGVFGGVDVFAGFEDAGVGDDDVEAAVVGNDLLNGSFEGGVIGDVADGSEEAFAGEVGDDVGVDVEADDGGAIVAKEFRSGAADTATGSGDDGDFVGVDLFGHLAMSVKCWGVGFRTMRLGRRRCYRRGLRR